MPQARDLDEDLHIIQAAFRLAGEDVVKLSTGETLRQPRVGERMYVGLVVGGLEMGFLYYRIKFALRYGWLPPQVDHRDRTPGHDTLDNLRAANPTQQNWNQGPTRGKASGLPKGVFRARKRFVAQYREKGRSYHLGNFDTPEEAAACYQAHCKATHGEFYADL